MRVRPPGAADGRGLARAGCALVSPPPRPWRWPGRRWRSSAVASIAQASQLTRRYRRFLAAQRRLASVAWLTLTQGAPHKPGCYLNRAPCRGARRLTGECPERQRGRTVNPLAYAFVGSSPTSPTIQRSEVSDQKIQATADCRRADDCPWRGCSSMVEQQPSKLMTRVRFPSPAPMFSMTCVIVVGPF